MILKSLYDFYQLKCEEDPESMPMRFWSARNVNWELRIDEKGKLVSIISYADESPSFPKRMIVPEQADRSGTCPPPYFLCDKTKYFIKSVQSSQKSYEASLVFHRKILDGAKSPECLALLRFLETQDGVDEEHKRKPKKDEWVVFRYVPTGDYIHDSVEARHLWEQDCQDRAETEEKPIMQCSVTGKHAPAARIVGISGLPLKKNAKLVSFDEKKEAFDSYGKKQGYNASISEEAAFCINSAFNYLVSDPNHHVSFGKKAKDSRTLLFWTDSRGSDEKELGLLSFLLRGDALLSSYRAEDEALLTEIANNINNARKGHSLCGVTRDTKYYLLDIAAPTDGRMAVRSFSIGTMGDLEDAIGLFLRDQGIADQCCSENTALGIGSCAMLTAPQPDWPTREWDRVAPDVPRALLEAVLKKAPFPESYFRSLILRMRIDGGVPNSDNPKQTVLKERAAMLKACLIRKARARGDKELERSFTVSLNREKTGKGYLIGRLFAIMERAQLCANPKRNTTIRDGYIGAAAATPAKVFPQLLKNAQHDISKAKNGSYLDIQLQEVMKNVDEFPATLSYDEQGQFFIGYYQQKADLYKSPKTSDESKEGE